MDYMDKLVNEMTDDEFDDFFSEACKLFVEQNGDYYTEERMIARATRYGNKRRRIRAAQRMKTKTHKYIKRYFRI